MAMQSPPASGPPPVAAEGSHMQREMASVVYCRISNASVYTSITCISHAMGEEGDGGMGW